MSPVALLLALAAPATPASEPAAPVTAAPPTAGDDATPPPSAAPADATPPPATAGVAPAPPRDDRYPQPVPVAAVPPLVSPDAPAPRHLVVKIAAGAFYSRLFAVQGYGAQGFVAFGSARDDFCWDIGVLVARGQTEHRLTIAKTRAVFSLEWALDRFRLGFAPSLGYSSVGRATSSVRVNGQVSLGGDLHASADLVQSEGGALFLRLSLEGESGVWGPALALGYRFDAKPVPRP